MKRRPVREVLQRNQVPTARVDDICRNGRTAWSESLDDMTGFTGRHALDSVDDMPWIRWTISAGIRILTPSVALD
jgi:hypothetical protein